jgi:hypothetical protein
MMLALLIYSGIQPLLRCNRILNISCKGTDGKDKSHKLSQEVNPNTHQRTMPAGCFRPVISSTPLPPVRHLVVIDSETEPESDSGSYQNDDEDYKSIIENQAGLPKSSPPPPVSNNVNHNVSNNDGEFFLKERPARTEFSVSQSSLQ